MELRLGEEWFLYYFVSLIIVWLLLAICTIINLVLLFLMATAVICLLCIDRNRESDRVFVRADSYSSAVSQPNWDRYKQELVEKVVREGQRPEAKQSSAAVTASGI